MALDHSDLLQPTGELWLQLWPGLSSVEVEDQLDEYLSVGSVRAADLLVPSADQELYQKGWAYYSAYRGVYVRMITTPAKVAIEGQGDRTYDPKQADKILALANGWLATIEALVPA